MTRCVLLGAVLLAAACGGAGIERRIALAGCDSLIIQGAIVLEVLQQANAELIVHGSSRALAGLEVEEGATATRIVSRAPESVDLRLFCPGTVGVQLIGDIDAADHRQNPQYDKLALYGHSRFQADRVSAAQLDLRSAGTSALNIEYLFTDAVVLLASGNAQVVLGGEAQRLMVEASGNAAVNALGLSAQDVTVSLGGDSRTVVHASAHLDGLAHQQARLSYRGIPDVDVTTADDAEIERH